MAPSRSNNNQEKREEHKKSHHLVVTRCVCSLCDINGTTTSSSRGRRYRTNPVSLLPHQEGKHSTTRNPLRLNHPVLRIDDHDSVAALNGDMFTWSKNRLGVDHHGLAALTSNKRASSADHRVLTSKQIVDIIDMALELTKDACNDLCC